MMMLGGSPLMVAAPPRLAAKISPMIMGTGSNRRKCARRAVATTRNKTTVMLSTNMDSSAASTISIHRTCFKLPTPSNFYHIV